MLAAAQRLSRAVVGINGNAAVAWQQALLLGSADFSSRAGGSRGSRGRSRGKGPPRSDDDSSLDDIPLDAMGPEEFQRRMEALAAEAGQRPSGDDSSAPELTALQEMNQHLEAAMSQLRNRAVMDHEEDRIDFLGKSPAEVEAVKEARSADRRDKWRRWVAAFPDDAAQLHRDTEWPMEEIPDRAAVLYETLRNYEGLLEDESDQSPGSRQ